MEEFATVIVVVFIVTSMAGIGLKVHVGDVWNALRSHRFLMRMLMANFVVVPLVGVMFVWLVAMEAEVAAALVLLACAAGGPSALQFTSKQGAAIAHAGGTAFVLSIVAVFVSPLLMGLALPDEMPVVTPYVQQFGVFFVLLVVPLAVGVWARSQAERVAARLARPVAAAGTVSFFAFVALTLATRREAIAALDGTAVAVLLGFCVVCMSIGWLAGGPDRGARRVLATATGMRNVALCLAIARHSFPGAAIDVPLVAFSALMIPPNLLFFLLARLNDRRAKSHQRSEL